MSSQVMKALYSSKCQLNQLIGGSMKNLVKEFLLSLGIQNINRGLSLLSLRSLKLIDILVCTFSFNEFVVAECIRFKARSTEHEPRHSCQIFCLQ